MCRRLPKNSYRFQILKELNSSNKYREFEVDYENFYQDLKNEKEEINDKKQKKTYEINLNIKK